MLAVTVIVPARDAALTLPGLLEALAAQEHPAAQVVVIDDASRDRTAEVARGVEVLRGSGAGSYAARNLGLAAATSPVVAFTDADCRPSPHWLSAAVAALQQGEVLAGRVRQRRHEPASVWERYDRATYLDQEDLVSQGFAATANLITHRSTLLEIGGFEARLRSSGDRELGRRLAGAGVPVRYCPDAEVEHEPRTTRAEIWRLHRRLGRGWRDLHRLGGAPPWWSEPALRISLGSVVEQVAADGPPLRRRHLAPVHAVAMTARAVGRLAG